MGPRKIARTEAQPFKAQQRRKASASASVRGVYLGTSRGPPRAHVSCDPAGRAYTRVFVLCCANDEAFEHGAFIIHYIESGYLGDWCYCWRLAR